MKSEVNITKKTFEPFQITITVESLAELKHLKEGFGRMSGESYPVYRQLREQFDRYE